MDELRSFFDSMLAMWNFADPAASLAAFDRRLPSASPAEQQLLRTQVARAHGLLKDFAAGNRVLDQLQEQSDLLPAVRVLLLLERGRLVRSAAISQKTSPSPSLPLFVGAYDLALSQPTDEVMASLAVDAAHMAALSAPDEASQLEWTHVALRLADQSPFPLARRWRASLLNNLGWIHHDAGRLNEALTTFQQAVAVRLEGSDARAIHIAHWCVARTFRSLGRHTEALDLLATLDASDPYVQEELALNRSAQASERSG